MRGRRDDGQLLDACALRRHGGHQHGRRIGGRPTGYADAHALQRQVALLQSAAVGEVERYVVVQEWPLKSQHVVANAANRFQKSGSAAAWAASNSSGGDAQRGGGELGTVELGRVFQHGRQTRLSTSLQISLHRLHGVSGSPKTSIVFCFARLADDVASRRELWRSAAS